MLDQSELLGGILPKAGGTKMYLRKAAFISVQKIYLKEIYFKMSMNVNPIDNRKHNMVIHGYLLAVQNYVLAFGLESTAAYVLKMSGIDKDDFIRCQLENGHENEKMLKIIYEAFKK